MGGHCVTHAAGHYAEFFKHLILVDPVIFSPDVYRERGMEGFASVEEHPVARRRGHFASVDEMRQRYADRMPYKIWQRAVFDDYCEYGLLPASSGEGFELACPGYVEASIYMGNFDANLYQLLPNIKVPVIVPESGSEGSRQSGNGLRRRQLGRHYGSVHTRPGCALTRFDSLYRDAGS